MIQLTDQPIDAATAIAAVHTQQAGAVVLFLGTVRAETDGRQTLSLDYQCYAELAEKTLGELEAEARRRWPLLGCAVIHRLGNVAVGETSVAIAVSSAHRQAAFAAGQWLIDRIKQVVPIWKEEHYADGDSTWIHPEKEKGLGMGD